MKTRPNVLFLMADQFRHDYLVADPTELHNIAGEQPAICK